ncbi:hypothetical protein FRUB_03465 [Fimbriiglobus ruber]|uniref:Uncharacterized protein n=1 Tax=Fimbriiglobus ruber TaxID=1908690 RepID=A0A225E1H0_9BACT|nr:hypothetical protein FRUB_03465 [Fimbriiglobus ruber]
MSPGFTGAAPREPFQPKPCPRNNSERPAGVWSEACAVTFTVTTRREVSRATDCREMGRRDFVQVSFLFGCIPR